jgi:hypothetical protein
VAWWKTQWEKVSSGNTHSILNIHIHSIEWVYLEEIYTISFSTTNNITSIGYKVDLNKDREVLAIEMSNYMHLYQSIQFVIFHDSWHACSSWRLSTCTISLFTKYQQKSSIQRSVKLISASRRRWSKFNQSQITKGYWAVHIVLSNCVCSLPRDAKLDTKFKQSYIKNISHSTSDNLRLE